MVAAHRSPTRKPLSFMRAKRTSAIWEAFALAGRGVVVVELTEFEPLTSSLRSPSACPTPRCRRCVEFAKCAERRREGAPGPTVERVAHGDMVDVRSPCQGVTPTRYWSKCGRSDGRSNERIS